jgi:hypothetical protein
MSVAASGRTQNVSMFHPPQTIAGRHRPGSGRLGKLRCLRVSLSVQVRAPAGPATLAAAASKYDNTAMEKQMVELQKLRRKAHRAQRVEESSKVEGEPTSEPGAGPLEVNSYLFGFCKQTS